MRRRSILSTALLTTVALAAGPASGASGKTGKATKLSCTLGLFAQGAPQGAPPSGIHFGFATCPRPFGKGLHYNSYIVTPSSPTQATVTGTFKNYYDRGTASGTASMTFDPTTSPNITYTGTVTYSGGSGRFKHVKGGGTIQCTTTDGGAHKSCTVNSTLTGL